MEFCNEGPVLARKNPISGGKSYAPKVRCGLLELDSHLCWTSKLRLGEYDAAFLLFPTERVLQNELLINRYFGRQADQCAMGVDHQRTSSFRKVWTQLWGSVSDNWNTQHEPLATSHPLPRVWQAELLLQH